MIISIYLPPHPISELLGGQIKKQSLKKKKNLLILWISTVSGPQYIQ